MEIFAILGLTYNKNLWGRGKVEIIKIQNEYHTYDIRMVQDQKILDIYQTGSDIGISCRMENFEKISKIQFEISDECELFQVFQKLYENIIHGNIFSEPLEDFVLLKKGEYYKCSSWYQNNVCNGVITVFSDAYPMDCPNIVRIKKENKKIVLELEQVEGKNYGQLKNSFMIKIDIRQSGSRLYEFAYLFRTLLSDLCLFVEPDKVKSLK